MNDYSQIYLEAMNTLKSFYNHELKENHVDAAVSAAELGALASQLKIIAMQKADI